MLAAWNPHASHGDFLVAGVVVVVIVIVVVVVVLVIIPLGKAAGILQWDPPLPRRIGSIVQKGIRAVATLSSSMAFFSLS